MSKALLIALTVTVVGLTAGSARAGGWYWVGDGVYAPEVSCGYAVRRRGNPSEIEYYFVYRCLVPEEAFRHRRHRKALRSRG